MEKTENMAENEDVETKASKLHLLCSWPQSLANSIREKFQHAQTSDVKQDVDDSKTKEAKLERLARFLRLCAGSGDVPWTRLRERNKPCSRRTRKRTDFSKLPEEEQVFEDKEAEHW